MRAFAGCLLGLAVMCLAIAWYLYRPESLLDRRLRQKSTEEYAEEYLERKRKEEKKRRTGVPLLDRLEQQAKKLGLDISGQSFLMILVGACVFLFVVVYSITQQLVLAIAAGALGIYAPKAYLTYKTEARYNTFLKGFDAALVVASSSLRAGASVHQAFQEIADKAEPVVAEEFARVMSAIRLGATPGEALMVLRQRVPGTEVDTFVVTTQSLMRTGGNLADMYMQIASMIVEQREFRDSMRAATTEGRITATVITAMPLLVIWLGVVNPGYFATFTTMPGGRLLLGLCVVSFVIGWLIIRRVLEVQVD